MREHHNGIEVHPRVGRSSRSGTSQEQEGTSNKGVPAGNVVLKFYFDGTTPRDSLNVPAGMPPVLRIGR